MIKGEVDHLRALKDNWDSYGAKPIDPNLIRQARDFIESCEWGILPNVVPLSSGGVQLECHTESADMELGFEPGNVYAASIEVRSVDADSRRLRVIMDAFLNRRFDRVEEL